MTCALGFVQLTEVSDNSQTRPIYVRASAIVEYAPYMPDLDFEEAEQNGLNTDLIGSVLIMHGHDNAPLTVAITESIPELVRKLDAAIVRHQ